jgi:hypothetical protein
MRPEIIHCRAAWSHVSMAHSTDWAIALPFGYRRAAMYLPARCAPGGLALDKATLVLSFGPMGIAVSPRGDMPKNRVPHETPRTQHALDYHDFR